MFIVVEYLAIAPGQGCPYGKIINNVKKSDKFSTKFISLSTNSCNFFGIINIFS